MAWKPPVNYRTTAVQTPTPEVFDIDASGVALLAEAPADPATYAMVVTVGGAARTRVTGTPTSGQYRVRSQTVVYADIQPHTEYLPLLEFHSSDVGLAGACSYYRTGTVYTRELMLSLIAFLRPLVGYDDPASLPAPTTDPEQRGCPGDTAILTNGSFYSSDGTQWLGLAGAAGAQFSRTKTATADAAVQTSYLATFAADAAVFLQSQRSEDVPADGVILAHMAATASADGEVVYNVVHKTQTVAADAAVKAARTSEATANAVVDAGIVDAITSPADGATVSSPVTATGTATTGAGVTAELWDEA